MSKPGHGPHLTLPSIIFLSISESPQSPEPNNPVTCPTVLDPEIIELETCLSFKTPFYWTFGQETHGSKQGPPFLDDNQCQKKFQYLYSWFLFSLSH